MPRGNSYDGGFDHAPSHVRAAQDAEWDWVDASRCRTHEGRKYHMWTITPGEFEVINEQRVSADKLIAMALQVCFGCPAQWECVSFALQTEADVGTWSVGIADLRWLRRRGGVGLAQAKAEGTPVQVMIAKARGRRLPRVTTAA